MTWTPGYYLLDALGSTIRLLDGSGVIQTYYAYDAFGKPIYLYGGGDNPFRWVGALGYYYDEELLEYYLRARLYDPVIARFLTQDPLGFGGGDWNLYRYVMNNPVNFVDPSGLQQAFDPNRDYCGSTGTEFVPDRLGYGPSFSRCCWRHDICYGTCGRTQASCDRELFNCMAQACWEATTHPTPNNPDCMLAATIYMIALSMGGGPAYNAAQRAAGCPDVEGPPCFWTSGPGPWWVT